MTQDEFNQWLDLALQKIGAICVPLNPGFKKSEMDYLLQDADASLILTEPETERLVREIDPKLTALIVDTQKPYHKFDFFNRLPKNTIGLKLNPMILA